ncbi:hypothetical protein [Cereibacter changlensis]|uniref:hypothetical protein n=1 Tax=Cereibacter changlensis TaxID=402884 RepID=UPI004034662D
MVDIPKNAADLTPPSDAGRRPELERLEFELLETDRALRTLQKREVGQRYWLRWVAAGTGILVIVGMAAALTHVVHSTFWGPFRFASGAFSVAMIVAPITSITAITVALFVGAFRKFDEKDLETLGSGAAGMYSTFRGN